MSLVEELAAQIFNMQDRIDKLATIEVSASAVVTASASAGGVPASGVIFWPSTAGTVPSDWSVFAAASGRFLVGEGGAFVSGCTGGASTIDLSHVHDEGALATASTTQTATCALSAIGGSDFSYPTPEHTHTISGSTGTALSSAQSILPPYLVGTWIQFDGS